MSAPSARYSLDERFGPQPRRNKNQYSLDDSEDGLNTDYRWLISTTIQIVDRSGYVTCWAPKGPGIDQSSAGYHRFSIMGKKRLCHDFVWEYHHLGINKEADISHLCHNKWCCRPSHLTDESRSVNKSRDNCPGYVLMNLNSRQRMIKVCSHDPVCCVVTVLDPVEEAEINCFRL